MATISSRLKNDGTLLLNGNFDEVTYTGNTSFAIKNTANTIYTTGEFDEVTFSTSTPVIKNLNHNTQNITTITWGGQGVTSTSNSTIAPDGSNTASRLLLSGNTSYAAQLNIPVIGGATYTFSFWVKYVSGSTGTWGINWYSGSHHRTTVPITGEWVRQSMIFTPDVGVTQINIYIADNRESLANILDAHVWGAQLEQSSSATIYQPIYAANTLLTGLPARKIANNGGYYVSGAYDEYTGAPVVDSSLVLWIDPGQTSSYSGSGTTVTDLSSSVNDMTLVSSPTFNTSLAGGSFSFNGTSQYGTVPYAASMAPTVGLTVSCWAYLPNWNITGSTYDTRMISKTQAGGYNLAINDGASFYGYVSGAVNVSGVYYNPRYALSNISSGWHNIVLTCDGRYSILYVDGIARETQDKGSVGTIQYTNNNSFMYGAEANIGTTPAGGYWTGALGPAMIYNRALTADEVAQNFNALRRRYGI